MSYNMMIGYDIYDCFTMEHFQLRQRMTLTTKIYCSRLYISTNRSDILKIVENSTKQPRLDCLSFFLDFVSATP
jgi:hypothetical protein